MNENNYVRAIQIVEGQKVWMPNKESCYELEKKLNAVGIETRVGNTCGTNMWSIYIISIPDILINTEVEL